MSTQLTAPIKNTMENTANSQFILSVVTGETVGRNMMREVPKSQKELIIPRGKDSEPRFKGVFGKSIGLNTTFSTINIS